ncbi:MAG: hypothetical protein KatS3mg131_1533 [Candidatus Tectimicrobiota bacterium]|nr:MAG: hypothetical protein KatS3mg131_1533 [Candidatus Tectomicrobia bacterium]
MVQGGAARLTRQVTRILMLAVLLPSACRPAASALAWWPALADAVRQRLEGHARLAGIVQARLDSGETAATWSLDLEGGLRLDRRSRLFLLLEAAQGPGLSGDLAEAFFGVNAEAGPPHARLGLTELWYMWQEGRFALTAGKLDLTRFFDTNAVANDPLLQFLAPGLVNAPGVAFPDPGPGLRLQWRPAAGAEVAAAWAAADVAGLVASPFVILELGLRPCGHWLQGHCRLYGWYGGETDGPPFWPAVGGGP